MGRTIVGIVAGFVVALFVILAVEAAGHTLFPPLPNDAGVERAASVLDRVPLGAKVTVLVGWFLAALGGGWVADRVAGRGLAGHVVAAPIGAGGVWTMVELRHPPWTQAGGVLLPFAGAFLAERLARRRF